MTYSSIGNTAVLVLGMHRSGTSALTGVLKRLGVDLGSNLGAPQPDNPTGFFEHMDIVQLHDEILMTLGTSWDDPRSLPDGWLHDPRIGAFRDQLASIIRRDFSRSRLWGIKDPRLCRLLPLWLELFDELNIHAKAILIARDPSEVSASLQKRNATDYEQATMLWLSYVLSSERHSRNLTRTIVLYDDLLSNWEHEIQRIRDVLQVDLLAFSQDVRDDVSSFLDVELRHHVGAPVLALPSRLHHHAKTVFAAMMSWRSEGAAPLDACISAAEELADIERGARPIVKYVRSRARLELDESLRLQSQAELDARRRLEALLHVETQAHSEDIRRTSEEAAQLRGEIALRTEDAVILRAEIQVRAEVQAETEAQLRTEVIASREAQSRAEVYAEVEAQLRSKALADAAAQSVRQKRYLKELQEAIADLHRSKSWRITRPIRMGRITLRRIRNRLTGRADPSASTPPL